MVSKKLEKIKLQLEIFKDDFNALSLEEFKLFINNNLKQYESKINNIFNLYKEADWANVKTQLYRIDLLSRKILELNIIPELSVDNHIIFNCFKDSNLLKENFDFFRRNKMIGLIWFILEQKNVSETIKKFKSLFDNEDLLIEFINHIGRGKYPINKIEIIEFVSQYKYHISIIGQDYLGYMLIDPEKNKTKVNDEIFIHILKSIPNKNLQELLIWSIFLNNKNISESTKYLLTNHEFKREIDINEATEKDGHTIVNLVCSSGNIKLLDYLLFSEELKRNALMNNEALSLEWSCSENKLEMTKYLLTKTKLKDSKNVMKDVLLRACRGACREADLELIKYLLTFMNKKGIFNEPKNNELIFKEACLWNRLDIVKYLIDNKYIQFNLNNKSAINDGVVNVIKHGHVKIFEFLFLKKDRKFLVNLYLYQIAEVFANKKIDWLNKLLKDPQIIKIISKDNFTKLYIQAGSYNELNWIKKINQDINLSKFHFDTSMIETLTLTSAFTRSPEIIKYLLTNFTISDECFKNIIIYNFNAKVILPNWHLLIEKNSLNEDLILISCKKLIFAWVYSQDIPEEKITSYFIKFTDIISSYNTTTKNNIYNDIYRHVIEINKTNKGQKERIDIIDEIITIMSSIKISLSDDNLVFFIKWCQNKNEFIKFKEQIEGQNFDLNFINDANKLMFQLNPLYLNEILKKYKNTIWKNLDEIIFSNLIYSNENKYNVDLINYLYNRINIDNANEIIGNVIIKIEDQQILNTLNELLIQLNFQLNDKLIKTLNNDNGLKCSFEKLLLKNELENNLIIKTKTIKLLKI